MAYNLGVPQRVFAEHPRLADSCYRLVVREADADLAVLEAKGLRTIFGSDKDPADSVFVYSAPR